MQISTLDQVHYRPSEKAKKIILAEKKKYPKKSLALIVDEIVINSKAQLNKLDIK